MTQENLQLWILSRSDTNQPVQYRISPECEILDLRGRKSVLSVYRVNKGAVTGTAQLICTFGFGL